MDEYPYKNVMRDHPLTGKRIMVQEHVYICLLKEGLWQKGFVTTPKGMEVHHVDFNPRNNDASNLVLISISEHRKRHFDREIGTREKIGESLRKNYETKTPEERAARIAKARQASIEKVKRDGPTPAQLEGLRKARMKAYGGKRFKP